MGNGRRAAAGPELMRYVPNDAHQSAIWPESLDSQPFSRSISDDDLFAWCTHLCYRPGEVSLCLRADADGIWPSLCDVDGYAQLCPALSLILPH